MSEKEQQIYNELKSALVSIKQYGSYEAYLNSFNTESLPHSSMRYKFFESLVKTNFKAAQLDCVCSSVKPKDIHILLESGQVSFIGREKFMYVYKLENLSGGSKNEGSY